MVGVTGIEPVTPTMSTSEGRRFNSDYLTVLHLFFDIVRRANQPRVCTMSATG